MKLNIRQNILFNRLVKEALRAVQIEKRGKFVSERIPDSINFLAKDDQEVE